MKQINDAATAADGIHHIGFETRWDHFLNEDGNAKTLTLTGTAMNGAGEAWTTILPVCCPGLPDVMRVPAAAAPRSRRATS